MVWIMEEAALLDGATIWQAFRYVAMPLARPGITLAKILALIVSWNIIFGVVLAGRTTRTLPVAVCNVLTFEQISWGPLAAAAIDVTAAHTVDEKDDSRGITHGECEGGVILVVGSHKRTHTVASLDP